MLNSLINSKTKVPHPITCRKIVTGPINSKNNRYSKNYSGCRSVSSLHVFLSLHVLSVSLSSHVCLCSLTSFHVSFFSSYDLSMSLSVHLSSNDDDNDHSSTQLPVQKTLTLRAGMLGLWPFIGWRIARFVHK